jgi:hypothetical protein
MRRHSTRLLLLISMILAMGESPAIGCSGSGAARAMSLSRTIGVSFGGLSIVLCVVGQYILRRRFQTRRVPFFMLIMAALQPLWWMSTNRGDCGYALRYCSPVFTLLTAGIVSLTILWPRRDQPERWRWLLSGATVGLLAGVSIAAVFLVSSFGLTVEQWVLAISVLFSGVIAGSQIGEWLWKRKNRSISHSISVRTLLLLPVVLAPLLAILLPVRPYEFSVSISRPFDFIAVDGATNQPIPGAWIRLIDPRFPLDDIDNQGVETVTGTDGHAEYFLVARQYGRVGLLGRTETTTYNPWMIRVAAKGYNPFYTSLASDSPAQPEPLTGPPLGMTFPPPPSVTIHLDPASPR